MRLLRTLGFLAILLANCTATWAENWPHWRGPAFNGSSAETGLPDRWSKTENLAWVAQLPGMSGSSPVVWGDSLFLPCPDADGKLLLLCINATNGKTRWQRDVAQGNRVMAKSNMTSPSAVTDGKRVAVMFGTGDLAAYDFEGSQLWSRNIAKQYGKFALMFFYCSSPLLYHDHLYVQVLQRAEPKVYQHAIDDKPKRESFLLCIDPQTGKELWRKVRMTDAVAESQDAYTSPIVHQMSGKSEILVYGADYVTAHNPDTGDELWRSPSLNAKKSEVWRTIATVAAGPEGVFACLPRAKSPVVGIQAVNGEGTVAWRNTKASSDVPSPAYHQGRLYVLDGNRQNVTCIDAKTGTTLWSGSLDVEEIFSASPLAADGKVYCISEEGTVVVLSAGDKFKILSRFTMEGEGAKSETGSNGLPMPSSTPDAGPILSSIAAAQGHLYVRTARHLYCVGGRRAKSK